MTAPAAVVRRRGRSIGRSLIAFGSAVSAVATKELRSRMRGRRAFVVVTVYLLLLSIFAFGIYSYLKQQAALTSATTGPWFGGERDVMPGFGGYGVAEAGLSASIGHALFSGLLMVETLLILVLAPAFTSGAISLEREKQTLDLLVTTPLSTMGMVVGKLVSALTYVFLLIVASIPLASLVFVFGGVGPEELVRGYALLFALAFGMGAIGLFISALVRRTQTATVLTYIVVLALTIGSVGAHQFLVVTTQAVPRGNIVVTQQRHKAPEALLWLNPFVADLDLVCTTAPGSYHASCSYMSLVTGRPYFGSQFGEGVGLDFVAVPQPAVECIGPACAGPADFGRALFPPAATSPSLSFPRDTFWPKSAAAFTGVGVLMTLLAAQLVAPTRRLRVPLPSRRRRTAPIAAPGVTVEEISTADAPPTERLT